MKLKTIIILAVSYILFISCGDVPVFTEMDTNRLKVVIKGTFETESKSNFVPMSGTVPTKFMFDIAELRLNGDKFANYRQVMTADLTDTDPFFSGKGIVLDNDDPAPGYYDTVQVYIRKMIFDGAEIYGSSGTPELPQVIFHEEYVEGAFDFNQYQQNTYVDSLKLNARDQLRSFPINIPIIGGLNYDKNDKETVLEIRFVIKNFIKPYKLSFYDSGVSKQYSFYALSDWLREFKEGDRAFGGNIIAVARAYVPGKTGSVTVTAGANQYVIAIPDGESIGDYFMNRVTTAASGARGFGCDLPQAPPHPGYRNIEALLDYYIKYEEYKRDWNNKVGLCSNFDDYQDDWKDYDDAFERFRIAPYVGHTGSGTTVTFNNMAPGGYNFYRANRPSSYGGLFEGTSPFTPAGSNPITITDDKITPNAPINIP